MFLVEDSQIIDDCKHISDNDKNNSSFRISSTSFSYKDKFSSLINRFWCKKSEKEKNNEYVLR